MRIKHMKLQCIRKMLHCVNSTDAVTLCIQRGTVTANSHPAFNTTYNTAAHAAFGGNANTASVFARTVVHSACKHQCLYGANDFLIE